MINKYYFVDFDSVGNAGFDGIETIGDAATLFDRNIYIIGSPNSKDLSFKKTAQCYEISILCLKIVEPNILDKIEFISEIIRINKDSIFYIISKDKEFNLMIKYYQQRGIVIRLIENFKESNHSSLCFSEIEKLYRETVTSKANNNQNDVMDIKNFEISEATKEIENRTIKENSEQERKKIRILEGGNDAGYGNYKDKCETDFWISVWEPK